MMSGDLVRLVVNVPPAMMTAIDDVRGTATRSAWVRQCLTRRLSVLGRRGLGAERIHPGGSRPSTWGVAAKRKARLRANDARRRARHGGHRGRKRRAAAWRLSQVRWTWGDDGQVWASDLPHGCVAAIIHPDGRFEGRSRHKLDRIVRILWEQHDSGVPLAERYHLFLSQNPPAD